ncbi:fatty acid desaturase family protein [Erythrobacter sp.]|uniref:fatty acid desaturase family protein n=1 Tax=Erythrobacter sp. TaxID=1042 RepID=UPI003C76C4A6
MQSLTLDEQKALSKCNVAMGMLTIAAQWGMILGALTLATYFDSFLLAMASFVVIATRQHALAILMHEAAHGNLTGSQKRDEWLSDFLLSFPLMVSTKLYRVHHLKHHARLGFPDDPDANDNDWPTSVVGFIRTVISDVTGLNFIRSLRTAQSFSVISVLMSPLKTGPVGLERRIGFVIFTMAFVAFMLYTFGWVATLLLWYLPLITLTQALIRFNAYAEHGGCTHGGRLESARTTTSNVFGRFVFAPCGINYHLEHHLYPSIPGYRLRALHERLMKDERYAEKAHVTDGYIIGRTSFVSEVCRPFA